MTNTTIRLIGQDDNDLRIKALGFIQNFYSKKFKTKPSALGEYCLVALNNSEILGTLCFDFAEDERLEIERYFQFESSILGSRKSLVSFSRWTSKVEGVGEALLLRGAEIAMKYGKTKTFSCAKPNLLRFMRKKYKLVFDSFAVKVVAEEVKIEDRDFFLGVPAPSIYVGKLDQWYNVLKQ